MKKRGKQRTVAGAYTVTDEEGYAMVRALRRGAEKLSDGEPQRESRALYEDVEANSGPSARLIRSKR